MGLTKFIKYYRIFHKYIGHRTLVLGALSLVSTLTEGVGIGLFFAFLQSLSTNGAPSALITKLYSVLNYVGIPSTLTAVILTMVGAFIIRGFLILLQNAYQYKLAVLATRKITEDVIHSFASMRYSDYLKRNTGYFTHLATKEIENSVTACYQVSAILAKGISVVTYLILSLQFEWRFTVLALFFGALTSLIYKTVNSKIKKYSQEFAKYESTQTGMTIQFLHSFKYLFSTNNTAVVEKKIHDLSGKAAYFSSFIGKLGAIIPATSEPLIVIFISACVYYQTQILKAEIAPLLVAIMFLYRVMKESTVMQASWQTLTRFGTGADRIQECLSELERNKSKKQTGIVNRISSGITLEKISYAYNEKEVLNQVALQIPSKSMVAFVGESGSGKSTLVDLIAGVLTPTQGNISVDGIDYNALDLNSLHQKIGYVTQDSVMFDDSVANNVSLWKYDENPADAEAKIWSALKQAGCETFVKQLEHGIQQKLGDRGVRLSGGQRQRIAIAREMFREPELLILDEATSSLDSESEAAIQRSIDQMKGKTTIIVIAHRLSTVKNCDQIFVLEKGRLVEQGDFTTLLKTGPVFKRMCEIQSLA